MSKRYFQDVKLRGRVDSIKGYQAKNGPMLFISLAIVKCYKNSEGKSELSTDWFDVGVFGNLVNEAKAIQKGDFVEMSLKLVKRKIQDEKGVTKEEMRLVAQEIAGIRPLQDDMCVMRLDEKAA